MACCVLHNIAQERRHPFFDDDYVLAVEPIQLRLPNEAINANEARLRALGFAKREQIIRANFK